MSHARRATIVVISGPKEHGKSTLSTFMRAMLIEGYDIDGEIQGTKFAKGVYEAAAAFTGDNVFLKNPEGAKKMRFTLGEKTRNITGTEVLQLVGTECGREVFGHDTWLRRVVSQAERNPGGVLIVDDCRFPNEAEIADVRIWIESPGVVSDQNQVHESEAHLPLLKAQAHIRLVRTVDMYFNGDTVTDRGLHQVCKLVAEAHARVNTT